MLYNEIKSEIKSKTYAKLHTTNKIIKSEMKTFTDILSVYLDLCGYLKSFGVDFLSTPAVKRDENNNVVYIEFEKRNFQYLILSKGSNINSDLVSKKVIQELAVMLERYIEQYLLDSNVQYSYFSQFCEKNFEGLGYVFNNTIVKTSNFIEYMDSKGLLKIVKTSADAMSIKKEEMYEIYDNYKLPDRVASKLERLKLGSFPKWKKHVLNYISRDFSGYDVESDGELLRNLDTDLAELETKLLKKDTNKSKK